MNNLEVNETHIVIEDKDRKCAPSTSFEDNSCISLDLLIEMAKSYNLENENKIKLYPLFETLNRSKYKKYLLYEFSQRFKNCSSQQCWTKQTFIDRMNKTSRDILIGNTWRPEGPKKRYEWLNSLQINKVMRQYEKKYKDFVFLDCQPIDFQELNRSKLKDADLMSLYNSGTYKIATIFNLDESWKSGSHWCALFANLKTGEIYFFDSVGTPPEPRIRSYMRKVARFCQKELNITNITALSNKIRHQYEGSECGVYSINFIVRLLRGDSFDEICRSEIPDDTINQCRLVYFN